MTMKVMISEVAKEPFPGILPERRIDPIGPDDPVMRGVRAMQRREEIREILVRYRLRFSDVVQISKDPTISEARYELASMLQANGWTLSRIGKLFKRHHTTVLYWLRLEDRKGARRG